MFVRMCMCTCSCVLTVNWVHECRGQRRRTLVQGQVLAFLFLGDSTSLVIYHCIHQVSGPKNSWRFSCLFLPCPRRRVRSPVPMWGEKSCNSAPFQTPCWEGTCTVHRAVSSAILHPLPILHHLAYCIVFVVLRHSPIMQSILQFEILLHHLPKGWDGKYMSPLPTPLQLLNNMPWFQHTYH